MCIPRLDILKRTSGIDWSEPIPVGIKFLLVRSVETFEVSQKSVRPTGGGLWAAGPGPQRHTLIVRSCYTSLTTKRPRCGFEGC